MEARATATEKLSYAPDRQVDVLHLKLEVAPNFQQQSVSGTATLRFKTLLRPVEELTLHAVDLRVAKVTSSKEIAAWQNTGQQVITTFKEPLQPGEQAEISISYSAEPKRGLYFRTPAMGYKQGETHCFTQGEAIEARHWFPSYDVPNEKFTTEMICRVPEGMVALSNGRLLESKSEGGMKLFHWLQDKPHANYLITLVAGQMEKLEDKHGDLPMAYWTPPSEIPQANFSFKHTKPSMVFFEREIGRKYPWDRYDQVVVRDFQFGGMENTGQTTLTEYTLHTDDTEQLYVDNSQGLVAHELAHQWFGDLVTCKDWNHLWLNEGFATYYAHLYDAEVGGWDELLYGLNGTAESLLNGNDPKPIVSRRFDNPDHLFQTSSHLVYGKASWVLHMLREELGADLFRKCVQAYLTKHEFGVVGTEDFRAVFEEVSGRSLDQFFDQWIYKGGYPTLKVDYSWDEKTKLAKLSIQQTQTLSPEVGLFNLPLQVRFQTDSGTTDKTLRVTAQSEDFYLPLPSAPKLVRLDPRGAILARINFEPTAEMLDSMLTHKSDMLGRLIAVRKLGSKGGHNAITQLKKALQEDPFYGVRVAAASGLGGIRTPEALDALIASSQQSDARVRRQVLSGIGSHYNVKAYTHLAERLKEERNPGIIPSLLRSVASYSNPEATAQLAPYTSKPSYRNEIAAAAIRSLSIANAASELPALMTYVRSNAPAFSSQALGEAIEGLGQLARESTNQAAALQFLLGFAEDPRDRVRIAAVRALGSLGDAKAIPALEKLAINSPHNRVSGQAQASLKQIRERQAPAVELSSVRANILDLQKENAALKKEMEDLRKRFEAVSKAANATDAPAQTNRTRPMRPDVRKRR